MADVFSYQNNIKTDGQVASADYARIAISAGGQRNSLVQSVEVNYQQQIEEVTQVGDTQIYWLPGRPQGRIGIQSLVGSAGFFKDWKAPCGKIDMATISIEGQTQGGKNGAAQCGFQGKGSLFFSGAIVERLSANLNTGRQTISHGADIRVASMSST